MVLSIINLPKRKWSKMFVALFLVHGALFGIALSNYIQWQSVNFIIGLLAIPLVSEIHYGKKSNRYGILALLFGVITFYFSITTLLFFTFLFGFLFLIESFYGKTNLLLLLTLLFLSPIFQYFINVFSFPIRLELTRVAGKILEFISQNSKVQGNIIFHNGHEFAVDPECMGLNMLVLSMIATLIFAAHWQKKKRRQLSLAPIALLLIAVVFLNSCANLLRIVCMVYFEILPGTVAHELIGIVFFVIYVLIPISFLANRIIKRWGRDLIQYEQPIPRKGTWILLHFALLVVCSWCCYIKLRSEGEPLALAPVTELNGYTIQQMPQQVIKLEKAGSLVYLKRIAAFYNADHTPYICWRGSGYSFHQIERSKLGSMNTYWGKLENDHETLYTAWWYQRNDECTTDQLTWRWAMLKGGENYSVVNVTAATKEDLVKEISLIVNKRPFVQLLK